MTRYVQGPPIACLFITIKILLIFSHPLEPVHIVFTWDAMRRMQFETLYHVGPRLMTRRYFESCAPQCRQEGQTAQHAMSVSDVNDKNFLCKHSEKHEYWNISKIPEKFGKPLRTHVDESLSSHFSQISTNVFSWQFSTINRNLEIAGTDNF